MPKMRKCKTIKNRSRKNRSSKNRSTRRRSGTRYRHKGGCNSCSTGSSPSTAPLWKSFGGANPEQISNSIYNYQNDPIFYSSS